MKNIKLILLSALTITTISPHLVVAQDNTVPQNNESEIVMTKEELTSLLTRIAEARKKKLHTTRQRLKVERAVQSSTTNVSSDNIAIHREFDRLHQRLDMLMMNQSLGNRATSQTILPTTNPSIIVNTPNAGIGREASPSPIVIKDDNALLNREINALNEEIRVLRQLASMNKEQTDYNNELKQLDAKLNELLSRQAALPVENTVIVKETLNPVLKGLEDYKYTVHFANNSTAVSTADIQELRRVAATVQEHQPRVTVVVRGFASNRGSAIYNNELSFNRTEAIKSILLQAGLDAKNILTLHHGIDYAKKEDNARRAEISFLVH